MPAQRQAPSPPACWRLRAVRRAGARPARRTGGATPRPIAPTGQRDMPNALTAVDDRNLLPAGARRRPCSGLLKRLMPRRPAAGAARAGGLRAAIILLAGFAVPVTGMAEWRTLQRTMFCRDHEAFTGALADAHGETLAWWGVSGDGKAVMELYRSPETGSWTLLRVEHDGTACALGGGESGANAFSSERERR